MSAENSQPSSTSKQNGRYERAAETALQSQPAERKKQSGSDYGVRPAPENKRGSDVDLSQITGLLSGGSSPPSPHPGNGSGSPSNAGRAAAPGTVPSEGPPRPALELEDDDEDEKPRRKLPKGIKEFAEENALDARELYKLMVPGSEDDGAEPISIGDMKDRLREVRALQDQRDAFEDERSEAMNKIYVARQQVSGVLEQIKNVVTPSQFASMFSDVMERDAANLHHNQQQLREFFPQWRDAAVMVADREMMVEKLATYGFERIEVETLRDARLIKFAMDALRLRERYERVKAAKPINVATTEKPSARKAPRHNRDTDAKRLADQGDIIGGVATLLG